MKNTAKNYISILLLLFLSSCSEEKNNRDYIILGAGRDTTIKVRDVLKGFASRNVLFKVNGIVNDSAAIFMTDATDINKRRGIEFKLTKGNNNFSDTAEAYSGNYKIYYFHQKATKGRLKIRIQLLSANGDTLTDSE